MADVTTPAKEGYQAIRRSQWIEPLTRIGFLCKGVVYVLLGALAVMYAFNVGGETTDQRGVMREIAAQPFGTVLLIVMAVGLLGYALWRFICAFSGADGDGTDAKGLGARAGHFGSGAAYTGIALYAMKLLWGGSSQHKDAAKSWTARLLAIPGGELLVVLAGLVVIGAGVFEIRNGLREEFKDYLRTHSMGAEENRWATTAGKWGHVARGVVFGMVGVFLCYAAWRANPNEARGISGVLNTVVAQPFGQWMLGLLALGLVCYGVYCMIEAKYRRIRT